MRFEAVEEDSRDWDKMAGAGEKNGIYSQMLFAEFLKGLTFQVRPRLSPVFPMQSAWGLFLSFQIKGNTSQR